jgi:catechol-2,3-dioxygenase
MSRNVLGLAHYNLQAPRDLLERLRSFYCEVVGLEIGPRPAFNRFGYWLYAAGVDVLHLAETVPGDERLIHVNSTFDHAAFRCKDLAVFKRALEERGIPFETSVVPQTGVVQLFLTDPAGNGVELQFSP